jgi:hypothetical protein
MRCPVFGGFELYASHRKGFFERSPLSWIGILPYRCGECQTRFYTWVGRRPQRRGARETIGGGERDRPARWPHADQVSVQVLEGRQRSTSIAGETANLSLKGMRLRLPISLAEGNQLSLALKEAAPRTWTVR